MADVNFQPSWFSKPGDTLLALMQRRKLSAEVLARSTGYGVTAINALLAGTGRIDGDVAIALEKAVGGTASFWLERQAQFDGDLKRVADSVTVQAAQDWIKLLPVQDMIKVGWISPVSDQKGILKSCLSYYDVSHPAEWQEKYKAFTNQFAFRSSPSYHSKLGALSAWLRQGELRAAATWCAEWNSHRFRTQLSKIKTLTRAKEPAYFIPRLRALCADAGVAVVFVRAPSGCKASGATRFVTRNRAMIVLSFRYLSDDHFWFTFFHEAGHLLIHGERATFVEEASENSTAEEKQANDFSAGMLVPIERRQELLDLRPRSLNVIRFAVSTGVSPGIIVGQMQHARVIGPGQLNHLKRRYDWDQISEAARLTTEMHEA
jgi:plasmid maintenance system antidote protein VapI/Zn-dependent peptidase ImmA (M78 family)